MDRKEVCEFLVSNEIGEGELMAYTDYGDQGCAAIGHNGMKFTFTPEQLAAAEPKMPKPKPKPKTRRKPATRKKAVKK